ncbi:hypothetical protein C8R48DRAFT_776978 [Suillus tomentosus]|nr:hypothetical protein C8R48DRAFT_776978 [Suillus tomentosus]
MSQSNFLAATVRWVSKMTGKAKAALEKKTMRTSSKKCRPEASGEIINPLPKKAKTNQPADTTPPGMTVSLPSTSPIPVTNVTPTPPPTDKSCCAVICMEEEEEALYADRSDADPKESDEELQSEEKEQDPQDKLKHLM